ncbi:MAG TPA: PEP-CTERM-box response regulator transcription factor [Candidatus Dormibacteraeota bacterium]|nr:PEP-CTERM-box response regulator transcription factor [Candidatus Dormibacteraeota bacterium]
MANETGGLLIVEDDPGLQTQLRWCFEGIPLAVASDRVSALAELRRGEPAVVLQDLGLPPDATGVSEGLGCMQDILRAAPATKIIVITGNTERASALRAIALGAYDFYEKPLEPELLRLIVQRAFKIAALEQENRRLSAARAASPLDGVIVGCDAMRQVCRTIEKVAPTSASVLLLGESGVGKEVLARSVHTLSPRAKRPFVAINCAAIPETLLESELFGFERGAFTGAHKTTPGKIEAANGGTLMLDEIGDMPAPLQSKLLRFLQERVIERIGGRESLPVDVRVVCATNQDLAALIAANRFREDLYYRISEVVVMIPPLREREGDSVVIAQHLLEERAQRHGKRLRGFTPDALLAIRRYRWPGNIRELENKVNSAVILGEGPVISETDLGLPLAQPTTEFVNLRAARQEAERRCLTQALALADGNLSRAAELMGITRPTLYDLMARFGLKEPG